MIKSRLYVSESLITLIFEVRLYAATLSKLVALDPEGLEPLNTDGFGNNLEELGDTVPSGITVGDESVYVTLDSQPYMLEIGKP